MNPTSCVSCGSCSSSDVGGKQKSSVNCNEGGCRSSNVTPICYCGAKAVLRTVRTAKNKGKRFWGCPNFKVMLFVFCVLFLSDFLCFVIKSDIKGIFASEWK